MRVLLYIPLVLAVVLQSAAVSHAQVYVSNYGTGTVGKYDSSTGAAIDASFISGLSFPAGVALDQQGHLFVLNRNAAGAGRVSEYDANSGALINANLVFGLGNQPEAIALDGVGGMYVSDFSGTIGRYSAVSGSAINSHFSSMIKPFGLAADGNGHLFVTDYNRSRVLKVATEPGAESNADFITGFGNPMGVALDGKGGLFVVSAYFSSGLAEYDVAAGTLIRPNIVSTAIVHSVAMDANGDFYLSRYDSVAKYNGITGEPISESFITGVTGQYIAVAIPEPAMSGLVGIFALGMTMRRANRRVQS